MWKHLVLVGTGHAHLAVFRNLQLKPFRRYKKFLLIFNLGDGKGIFWRNKLSMKGRFAFQLKRKIDERFIRTSQKLMHGG